MGIDMLGGILEKYPKEFHNAARFVFNAEGPDGKVTVDTGGKTKYGICQKSYPDLDIENLTVDQAIAIYFDRWKASKAGSLPEPLSIIFYNISFNGGESQAVEIVQSSCNGLLQDKISKDGKWGAGTDAALTVVLKTKGIDVFFDEFILQMFVFYAKLAGKRRKSDGTFAWKEYLLGWCNRTIAIMDRFDPSNTQGREA